jgi:transcriptional regulator with PAS, ATPase and Fis domain
VDCSALVGTLLESELFGHVKGSFTSAIATKYGRFELANGGTIFFDEVANLSHEVQAKFLRVLQEREFSRVGSSQVVRVDVRVLAATNKDLLQAMKAGTFREDLYYRLSVLPIVIPPLRQHKKDIPLLAEHFLEKYNRKRKRGIRGLSPEAMEYLMRYDWPGNIRELENAIERAVVLSPGDMLEADMFSYLCEREDETSEAIPSLSLVERKHIILALRHAKGNKTLAARLLGIHRKTLWRKLKEHKVKT